jgi:hypothetical protein
MKYIIEMGSDVAILWRIVSLLIGDSETATVAT